MSSVDKLAQSLNKSKAPIVPINTEINSVDKLSKALKLPITTTNPDYNYSEFGNFAENPDVGTNEPVITTADLLETDTKNAINSFKQGVDQTQNSNYLAKQDAFQKIVDDNYYKRQALKEQLDNKQIHEEDYIKAVADLDNQDNDAIKSIAEYEKDISDNKIEMENEPVSKIYKLKEAMVQAKGGDAGLWESIKYTAPSTMGSSASLLASQLVATFGANLTKTLASAAAESTVGGPAAPWVAAGLTASTILGELAYGRHQETLAEQGGQLEQNQATLLDKWKQENPFTDFDSLQPDAKENVLRDIRVQARKGLDDMYWQQMALVVPDAIEAMLMPGSKVLGAFSSGKKLEKAVEGVTGFNKTTRLGTTAAKAYTNYLGEKFEEGYQYATEKRQTDAALDLKQYENKGVMSNILSDAYDTISSISYGPWGTLKGDGKYSEDKQFQFAEQAGGLLAALTGGLTSGIQVAQDLNTYRKTIKELQSSGVANAEDKWFKLKDQIYTKHFDNNTLHYLLEGVRTLADKKDDKGIPYLTKQQAEKEKEHILKAFDKYNEVNQYVDELPRLGKYKLKYSPKQALAIAALKQELFHTSMNMVREEGNIQHMATLANLNNLIQHQETIIDKITSKLSDHVVARTYNINNRYKLAKSKLEDLNEQKKQLLTTLGIADNKDANVSLEESNKNREALVKELNAAETKENYDALLKVKDNDTLMSWFENKIRNQKIVKKDLEEQLEPSERTSDVDNFFGLGDETAEPFTATDEEDTLQRDRIHAESLMQIEDLKRKAVKQKELEELLNNEKNLEDLDKNSRVKYAGMEGRISKHPEEDVYIFTDDATGKQYDIPKDEKSGYKGKTYEYGIFELPKENPITDLIDIEGDKITINGKTYVNGYSNPLMAINRDKEGNVVSVTLSTTDGKPRTFKKYADELAYAILLQTYNNLENESKTTRKETESRISGEVTEADTEREKQSISERDSEESKKIEEAIANLEKGIAEARELYSKNSVEREQAELFEAAMESKTSKELLEYYGLFKGHKYTKQLNDKYKELVKNENELLKSENTSTDYDTQTEPYEPSLFGFVGLLAENVFRTVAGTDNSTKETEERYFRYIQNNNLAGHKLLVVTKTNNPKLYAEILSEDKTAKEFEDKNPNYPGIWTVIVDETNTPVLSNGKMVFTTLISARHVDKTGIKDKEQAKKDITELRNSLLKETKNVYLTILDVTPGVSVQRIAKSLDVPMNEVKGHITKDTERSDLLELPTQSTDGKTTTLRNGQKAVVGRLYAFDDEGTAWALESKTLDNSQANTIVRLLLELAGIEKTTSDNPLSDLRKIVNMSLSNINKYTFGVKDNFVYLGEEKIPFEDLKNPETLVKIVDFLEQKYNNANTRYAKEEFQESFEEPVVNPTTKEIEYRKWNTYQDYLLSKFGTYLPELGQPRYRNSYVIFDPSIKEDNVKVELVDAKEVDTNPVSTKLPETTQEPSKKTRTRSGKSIDDLPLSRSATLGKSTEKLSISELNWFKNKFPNIPIEFVKGLIDNRDFGQFLASGKILLSDLATTNTLRHEAWHVVTQLYLTQDEINKLYTEARARLNNKNLTDRQVEEILAEDFANYKDTGTVLSNRPLRNTLFRRILNFLKELLGISPIDIRNIYNKLETGYFTNKPIVSNRQFTKLSKAFTGKTESFTKKVLDDIDAKVYSLLFKSNKGLTPAAILQTVNLSPVLLDLVKDTFIDRAETLENSPLDEAKLAKIAEYDWVIDNWAEVIEKWKKRWASLGVSLVTDDNLKKDEKTDVAPIAEDLNEQDETSVNDDEKITEEKGERSGEAFQESNTVNTKDVMFKQTKMLIRTLIKVNADGTPLVVDGYESLVDFNKTYTFLLKNLAGISEYEDQYAKIEELSKSKPEFKQLLERILPPSTTLSQEQILFQNQFRQDFDKNFSNSYTTVLKENGEIYLADNTKESVSGRIKEKWINNLRDPNRKLLSINQKGRIVVDPSVDAITDNLEFLNAIGIKFSPETLEVIKDSKVVNDSANAIRNYIKNRKYDITDMYNSKEKVKDSLYSRINNLLDLDASYTSEISELSYNSTTGKTVYAMSLNNTLSIIKNIINNSKSLEDLYSKLPNLNSVYAKNSLWLKQMFDENGKKRKGIAINLDLLDGLKTDDSINKAAVQTTKLVEGDKLVQELNNILLKGKSAYLRSADASTEHAISLSTYGQGNHLAVTIDEIKEKGFEHRKIKEIFNGYFRDELNSIAEFVLNGLGENIKNYNKAAAKFRIFEGFNGSADIKKTVLKELEKLKGKTKEEQILGVDAIFDMVKEDVEIATISFFKEYSGELANKYKKFGIEERNKLGIDVTLKDYTIKELMDTLAVNDMINSIEQVKLFVGDMAFYTDLFKRTKGLAGTKESARVGHTMDAWLNANHKRLDGKQANGKINVAIFEDSKQKSNYLDSYINKLVESGITKEQAEVLLKAYTKMDEGDAQGWITLDEYKEFFIRAGKWTKKHEKIHDKAQRGETLAPEELFYYMTLKAQYFGPQVLDGLNVPTYHKFSLMPLIPSLIKGTNLESFLERLQKQEIGYALFSSGSKVGTKLGKDGKANKFYTETISGTVDNTELVTQQVYYRFLGIQLEIEPKVKKEVTFGTQFRKLLFSNLFENGAASNTRFSELLNEYSNIFKTLIADNKKKLLEDLHINGDNFEATDVQKLVDLIKKEAEDRTLPDNIIDALQKDAVTGKLMYKFDTLVNKSKIDNLVMNLINARLIKQMTNGDAYIQGASTGFENKGERKVGSNDALKFYSSKDGKTIAAECMIPLTGNFKQLLDRYGSLEAVNKALEGFHKGENTGIKEEWITLVGYRIPTQGMNSIDFFKIKKFLPPETANLIILPTEIVAKSGGDYDIDKMNIFRPHLKADTKIKQLQNRVIEIAKEILEHEDNFIPLITPNSTSILTDVVKEIRLINWKNKPVNRDSNKTAEELAEALETDLQNNIRYTNQLKLNKKVEQFTAFLSGKAGVGIAALQNTHHIISQIANLTLNNSYNKAGGYGFVDIKFDHNKTKDGKINLAAKKAADGKNNISEVISQVINAVVDIAKDPFIVDLNMNLETLSTYLYLVRVGAPFEDVAYFMSQPIISDFLKEKAVNSSVFLKATGENKNNSEISRELMFKYLDLMKFEYTKKTNKKTSSVTIDTKHFKGIKTLGDLKTKFRELAVIHHPDKGGDVEIMKEINNEYELLRKFPKLFAEDIKEVEKEILELGDEEDKFISNYKEKLKGYLYKDNQKGAEFVFDQLDILNDYLAYKEQADLLSEAIQSTNHDTTGVGANLEASWNKLLLKLKVKDTDFVNNIDNIYNNTFIGDFDQHQFSIDVYKQFYQTQEDAIVENSNFMSKLIDPFGAKNQNKLKTLLINDFINYVVQNYGFEELITKKLATLFSGENSVAKQLLAIKNGTSEEDKEIRENLLVKELFPLIDKPKINNDAIKIFSKRIDTFTYNSLVESFRELETKRPLLYRQLAEFGILQSGLNNSPITYFGLIPFELNGDLVNKAFDNFHKKNGVEDLYKFNQLFIRNNSTNAVVSRFARANRLFSGTFKVWNSELEKFEQKAINNALGMMEMYGKDYDLLKHDPKLIDFKNDKEIYQKTKENLKKDNTSWSELKEQILAQDNTMTEEIWNTLSEEEKQKIKDCL